MVDCCTQTANLCTAGAGQQGWHYDNMKTRATYTDANYTQLYNAQVYINTNISACIYIPEILIRVARVQKGTCSAATIPPASAIISGWEYVTGPPAADGSPKYFADEDLMLTAVINKPLAISIWAAADLYAYSNGKTF